MALTTKVIPAVALSTGVAGAVVGGTVAAVRDGIKVNEGEMTTQEAVKHVAKESAGTGIAAASGMAVTAAVGVTGLLGLVAFAGVATGVKHLWDKKMYAEKQVAITEEAAV